MEMKIPVAGGNVVVDALFVPDAVPVPVPPVPVPPTPPAPTPVPPSTPSPTGVSFLTQNMAQGSDGIWRSNNLGSLLKCYAQFRTPQPANYIKLTCRRQTNVIPNGKFNLKDFRAWPDGTYPDDYVAYGVGMGAYQFTTEQPTKTWGYFSTPLKADTWIDEAYEFDFMKGVVNITRGGSTWSLAGWNPGAANRTQFGVQCVIASDPAPQGLPASPYCYFDKLAFEWH